MTVLDTYDHLKMTVALPCWHCGVPTPWVELNFETALHPGPCTRAKWAEFDAEIQWRDPAMPPWPPRFAPHTPPPPAAPRARRSP